MARSRVELFEAIRRDRRVEHLSIRELSDRHRVHRRLPPEPGEALSFLGEVPMAPLGIEAALSANSILLENCPIHPTSAT